MRLRTALAAALLVIATPALAMIAVLVNSRTGTSVTGQSVWVCTYQANGQTFERVIAMSQGPCPPTVEVF